MSILDSDFRAKSMIGETHIEQWESKPDAPISGGQALMLISVSHHHAPLELRERLAFDEVQRAAVLSSLRETAAEVVGITTCNRTEFYVVLDSDGDKPLSCVLDTIATYAGIDVRAVTETSRLESGDDVATHLFRVASGLDSVILGEPQILGQVRDALLEAHELGTTGPVLERLFQRALATGKRARSQTRISQGAASISHAAVKLARDILGELDGKRALTVGLGEMGCLVAKNLVAHGIGEIAICNRTAERAEAVAEHLGGTIIPWDDLAHAASYADVVITATASVDYVVTPHHLISHNGHQPPESVLVIDISVPRNVDPAVDHLPHVHRYDIDALQQVRVQGMEERGREVPKVEAIIAEEVDEFTEWYRGRQLSPVIRELYRHAGAIQGRELDDALARLGHLSERDREVVRALAHGITRKLLHTPVSRMKDSPTPHTHAETLVELFELNAEAGRQPLGDTPIDGANSRNGAGHDGDPEDQ